MTRILIDEFIVKHDGYLDYSPCIINCLEDRFDLDIEILIIDGVEKLKIKVYERRIKRD
jgi:hypothetical protein